MTSPTRIGTRIQQPSVRPTETMTNVRVESFGGLPHQPIVFQSVCSGARVASRMRLEASAAPRRITQDAASATSVPTTPMIGANERALEQARDASERGEDRERRAAQEEGRQRQLSRLERVDHPVGIQPRAVQLAALGAPGKRLDLPEAVEVPELGRDVPNVRHDEVARDELDAPADRRTKWARALAGARSVVAVPGERLERLDHVPVRLREQIRASQRLRARDLVHHLALARAGDLDRVEVLRDLVLVAREQL